MKFAKSVSIEILAIVALLAIIAIECVTLYSPNTSTDISVKVNDMRRAVAYKVLPAADEAAILRLKQENARLQVALGKAEEEASIFKLAMNKEASKAKQLQAKLDNALVPEATVGEAMRVHVTQPVSESVKAGYSQIKTLVTSYEFKPEVITSLWQK